ncbi:RNA polymerase sigma-70 factor, ECF subfamily [Filimonas lacunae]|uniref:RNA polymerase sigma-70 factor, ECF subfamily n=1 Tax=Filimonas lacunae TaxID=477680 RepID=A0A173MBR3_9BACT|nr:sigma-70 family RNA polymerase sigma factor [Filimonas lacunae]BAV04950.1 RNA polymerase ECF-type sigma factor [Filimonas lacunae]SIT33738.1 RNA polymerase sigma-70 factor, ECF subfamily [Filimonas lacunae]
MNEVYYLTYKVVFVQGVNEHFDEQAILRGLADGNPDVLVAITELFTPGLLGFACKVLHEPFMAMDILQDVYIRFWEHEGSFLSLHSIRKYLYVSVRNACINYNKKRRRQQEKQVEDVWDEVGEEEVMRHMVMAEYLGMIYSVVDKLPEKTKEIFYLSFEKGLGPEEIAKACNIPYQTVKNRKGELFKKLKEILKRHTVVLLMMLYWIQYKK